MNEVTIPLKISGITQMRNELRELKGAIATATDPAQMDELAQKAGEVADRLKDANEQAAVFTAGSKFEIVSNSLAGVAGDLASLDFEGANDKSKVFAKNLANINPKDIAKGFKDFAGMLGTLGKAFIKLGATILMNPIFLIVAAVVAIIAVIALVLKSFGLLDGVIKALMAPINALIAGFKAMTDWLGLTTFAAEDNAEKTAAANKKVSESSKAREAQVVGDLGREIAELKAAGEETAKLEEEVSNTKIKEANKRKEAAKVELEATKKLDSRYNKDKLEELKKQIDAENEIIKQANSDKVVARNAANKKEIDDLKTKADANNKEAESKAKAARDKRLAADKASEDQIAAARKIVTDSTKTAQQIEVDDLKAAYAIKIAEATKYKNDTTALVEAQKIQEAAIIKKYDDAANLKRIADEDAVFLETQRLLLNDTEFKKLQATQAAEAKMDIFYKDAEIVKGLEKELAAELVKIQDDANKQKTANLKAETDKQKAIDDAAHAEKIKNIDAGFKLTQSVGDAIAFMQDTNITAQLKKVKKGSKEEEVLLKKQFEQNKKAQLAAAIINAAQAQVSILAQYPKFDGGFAMVAAMAGAAITSAMAIGKITAASFSGGGSTPDSPDSSLTSTTAVAPTTGPNLFGNANTGSQVNAGGNSNQNITVTAIVSETEITASQQHINNIQQNSVL
jgi:hypothetical protein